MYEFCDIMEFVKLFIYIQSYTCMFIIIIVLVKYGNKLFLVCIVECKNKQLTCKCILYLDIYMSVS